MKPQTEKPGATPEQLVACLGLPPEAAVDVKMSGGQFENFARGWAKEIMYSDSSKAHWFTRDGFAGAVSLCGMSVAVRFLYGPGNYGRCGNCRRVMTRQIRQGLL